MDVGASPLVPEDHMYVLRYHCVSVVNWWPILGPVGGIASGCTMFAAGYW